MIILRSITDSFDLLLGSQYTQLSLAVAYFVTLHLRDWKQAYFEPQTDYWVNFDNKTSKQELVCLVLHLAYGIVFKFHEISRGDNTVLTGLCLGAILMVASDMI